MILVKMLKFHLKSEISRFCDSGRLATASTATAKDEIALRAGRGKITRKIFFASNFLLGLKNVDHENEKIFILLTEIKEILLFTKH